MESLEYKLFCRFSWEMILPEGTAKKEKQIDKLVAITDFFQIPANYYLALSWGIFCRKHAYPCNPLCSLFHPQTIMRRHCQAHFLVHQDSSRPFFYPSVLPDIIWYLSHVHVSNGIINMGTSRRSPGTKVSEASAAPTGCPADKDAENVPVRARSLIRHSALWLISIPMERTLQKDRPLACCYFEAISMPPLAFRWVRLTYNNFLSPNKNPY